MVWQFNYLFLQPIQEQSITGYHDIKDVKFIIDNSEKEPRLIGFGVLVDIMHEEEAKFFAQIKANRIYDYLTGYHKHPITGSLANYVSPDGKNFCEKIFSIKNDNYTAEILDLFFVEEMLAKNNIKLLRQLSHYRLALKSSSDDIAQICEFYMIIEDEYGDKNHPKNHLLENYKSIRDLVSHPFIGDINKKDYLDLSDPRIFEDIKKMLGLIKSEAEILIKSKL
jgi:hypothetical protein